MATAPRDDTAEALPGTGIPDPFQPLEDLDAPATIAWREAQEARTRSLLDTAKAYADAWAKALRQRLNYPRRSLSGTAGQREFFYENNGLERQFRLMVTENGQTRTLIDPNQLDSSGAIAIGGCYPSPTGDKVAIIFSRAGSDWQWLEIRDTTTGAVLETISDCKFPSISWREDEQSFLYNRPIVPPGISEQEREHLVVQQAVWEHRLGTPSSNDTMLWSHENPEFGGSAFRLKPFEFIAISRGTSRENGLVFRPAGSTEPWQELWPAGRAKLGVGAVRDGKLYAFTTEGNEFGRIVCIDPQNPDPSQWQILIDGSKDNIITGVREFADHLLVESSRHISDHVAFHDFDGTFIHDLPVPAAPPFSIHMVLPQISSGVQKCQFMVSGYQTPGTVYEYDATTHQTSLVRRSAAPHTLEGPDYVVEQVQVPSKDGTLVPMTIIRRADVKLDGTAATILYGYGGFDVPLTPSYGADIAEFVSQGGIYCIANLRGGGEYGEAWHQAGMGDQKQNVFDDFAACAEWLHEHRYTSPPRLAIEGGSNGGLLTAVVMQQRPELFGAVISAVPVTDMMRYDQVGAGIYWRVEYGDPADPAEREVMLRYSPLHNVRSPPPHYPPVMVETGTHDNRVAPWHAYKLVAALQAAGQRAWLYVNHNAGHGAGTSLDQWIEKTAAMMVFLRQTLGPINQQEYRQQQQARLAQAAAP